jgi:micrococcal nuclease
VCKRVVNGHYVKLKDDEKLNYLGVRAPYEHEPRFNESKLRNEELVVGQELRLRYDDELRDSGGRLWAYAFLKDGTFVNEVLIREGLAYVRARPHVVRFRDQLIAAQNEARKARRGLWAEPKPSAEPEYFADPKYAEFHRPSCETAKNIKPERLTKFASRNKALDQGFSPCDKCLP